MISDHQYHQALEDAKAADELEPNNSKTLHRLARIYTHLGQPDKALDAYAQIQPPATAKDKAQAQVMQQHLHQAEAALREGTSGSMVLHALDQAERGLGLAVSPPRKWKLMRGEACLKMGNINAVGEAQNIAMSLLRSNNHDPEALVLRGRAFYGQGENDKAIQHFRRALDCDPDLREAARWLKMVRELDKRKEEGNAAYNAGRIEEAVRIYSQALEIDAGNRTTNSKILQNRAQCYMKVSWNHLVHLDSIHHPLFEYSKLVKSSDIKSSSNENTKLPSRTARRLCNSTRLTSKREQPKPKP